MHLVDAGTDTSTHAASYLSRCGCARQKRSLWQPHKEVWLLNWWAILHSVFDVSPQWTRSHAGVWRNIDGLRLTRINCHRDPSFGLEHKAATCRDISIMEKFTYKARIRVRHDFLCFCLNRRWPFHTALLRYDKRWLSNLAVQEQDALLTIPKWSSLLATLRISVSRWQNLEYWGFKSHSSYYWASCRYNL